MDGERLQRGVLLGIAARRGRAAGHRGDQQRHERSLRAGRCHFAAPGPVGLTGLRVRSPGASRRPGTASARESRRDTETRSGSLPPSGPRRRRRRRRQQGHHAERRNDRSARSEHSARRRAAGNTAAERSGAGGLGAAARRVTATASSPARHRTMRCSFDVTTATCPGVRSRRHVPSSLDSSHDARGHPGVSTRTVCSAGLPSVAHPIAEAATAARAVDSTARRTSNSARQLLGTTVSSKAPAAPCRLTCGTRSLLVRRANAARTRSWSGRRRSRSATQGAAARRLTS